MNPAQASAPGKIILLGEHAVVYGQPALAVPVTQVQATASVSANGEALWIEARSLNRRYRWDAARPEDPLAAAVRLTLDYCRPGQPPPAATVAITSTLPIASGLGSGAAVCTAVVRALAQYLDHPLSAAEVSGLVFETEKLLHGTPSGIDNTVIAYGQPVYFVRGQPPTPFTVAQPLRLLIADTGRPSPTKLTVGDVRAAWTREPRKYEALFQAIGDLVRAARALLEAAAGAETLTEVGRLLTRNHALLGEIGVSSPELDRLATAAQTAGALGAKLSGGGRGGNLIALVTAETEAAVQAALLAAGARRVLSTAVAANPSGGEPE